MRPPQKTSTDLGEAESGLETVKRATCLDILRTRSLILKGLILFYNWFVNSFCYYGLTLNAYGWGKNFHLGFAINGILEIPAYAFVSSNSLQLAVGNVGTVVPFDTRNRSYK